MIIQTTVYNIYATLLNIIGLLSIKLSEKTRQTILLWASSALSVVLLLRYFNKPIRQYIHYGDFYVKLFVTLLLLVLIASIDRRIGYKKKKTCDLLFLAGWLLCFLTILITSFLYPVKKDYFWWGILSITIFPMLMVVWNERRDYSVLFSTISRGVVFSSFVYLALQLLFCAFIHNDYIVPGDRHIFLGLAPNPNNNGIVVIAFFTAALYLLFTDRKHSFIYFLSLSISIMFGIISNSRTAELAMILEGVAFAWIYHKYNKEFIHHKYTIKIIAVIAITIATSVLLGYALMYLDRIDINAYAISEGNEYLEAYSEVHSNKTLTKINELSSGRIVLWAAYIKKLTFKGHGNPMKELWSGYGFSKWAHNNALDIWYASGFPAFLGYAMWLLAGWIFIFRCLFTKNCFRKEYLLTILAFVGYFVVAMLEITIYPTNTGIVFLMYMTLGPIMFKEGTLKGE